MHAALSCITAAVVGVILNLSLWFALHTLFKDTRTWQWLFLRVEVPVWHSLQPVALGLSGLALLALLRFKLAYPRALDLNHGD